MQTRIVARKMSLTNAQREIIDRRLGFALGRFANRVREVTVRFTDVNGPRGGIDTTCQITAKLSPRGEVQAEYADVGVEAAVSRAVERLSRRVATELERRRTPASMRTAARRIATPAAPEADR